MDKQERLQTLKYAVKGALALLEDWRKELRELEGLEKQPGPVKRYSTPAERAKGAKAVRKRAKWSPAMRRAQSERLKARWRERGADGFKRAVAS